MDKEIALKWLRECSDEGSGVGCEECPFASCDDCAGELMKEAAKALTEK